MSTLHNASVLVYFHEFNLNWLGVVLDSCWIQSLSKFLGSIPHWGKKFQSVRGQLWNLLMGRLTLKMMEGGWIYHWIDLSNMHKVLARPTVWSNSTGELANGKFYAVDTTACLRTLLSSARGYTWAGKICTSSKGSIIQLNHDRLGSGYWP